MSFNHTGLYSDWFPTALCKTFGLEVMIPGAGLGRGSPVKVS